MGGEAVIFLTQLMPSRLSEGREGRGYYFAWRRRKR